MRSARSWLVSVLAMLACLSAVGPAQAQSESKTWYVPWAWSLNVGEDSSSIAVMNLNGQAVRVNVRAFNSKGAVLSAASAAYSVLPATSWVFTFPVEPSGSGDAKPAFALILADQPVIVRARVSTVSHPYLNNDCKRVSSRGTTNGALFCAGNLGRYDADGKFDTDSIYLWRYSTLQEWPAFPIDCTGSAPTHFACSQRVARQRPGGDVVGKPASVDRQL